MEAEAAEAAEGGTKKAPFNDTAPKSYLVGTNGTWVETTGANGEKQYQFRLNGGNILRGMWARLEYPETGQTGDAGWYRFDGDGNMQSGWICDEMGEMVLLQHGEGGELRKDGHGLEAGSG